MTKSQRPPWLGEDYRGWDHVRVHLQLLSDPRLGAYELATYMGLAAHAETSTGRARPSAARLAKYADMSARKVRECFVVLRDLGYIDIEHRDGLASMYRLLPPPPLPTELLAHLQEPVHEVQGSDRSTVISETDGPMQEVQGSESADLCTTCSTPLQVVQGTLAPGATELEPENKNQERDTRSRSRKAITDDDPDFAAFWSAYPNKRDKGAARGGWPRALKQAGSADVIISGAERYRDDPNRDDRFTKHPATWLNHECWADPPLPARLDRAQRSSPSAGKNRVAARLRGAQ